MAEEKQDADTDSVPKTPVKLSVDDGRSHVLHGAPIVWLLHTPLYGQGDAGRIWYRTIHTQLIKQGFARSHHDSHCSAYMYVASHKEPHSEEMKHAANR
eukprot:scaffold19170_cov129-Isochrysis_galbana.AAC.3